MRKFLFFLFLTTQGVCMGQFHTLKSNISIFKIETQTEEPEEGFPGEKVGFPLPDKTEKPDYDVRYQVFPDTDSIRRCCLGQYYSVCPPLKRLSVSSRFGYRTDPFDHETPRMHHGLDLRAPVGTEVFSMFAGEVLRVSSDERSGKFITIRHGEYTISYCHLHRQLVKAKECVRAGDIIGLSGNTGRSTGPHLHLTVRRKGEYINPAILLNYILDVRTRALEELGKLLG